MSKIESNWADWFKDNNIPMHVQLQMWEMAKAYCSHYTADSKKVCARPRMSMPYSVSGSASAWFGFIDGFIACYTLIRSIRKLTNDDKEQTNETYSG